MLAPTKMIQELEAHDPAPPDVIEAARELINDTIRRKLSLTSSVITSYLMSMMRRVPTTAIPTLAVTLAADGIPILMFNPEFTVKLGEEGVKKVLVHEAYHLILLHLYADPHLRTNSNWELATELCINYRMMKLLDCSMPTITNEDGKEETTGIDPVKVFDQYKRAMKAANLDHVETLHDFTRTDLGCLAELERMPKPPKVRQDNHCIHGDGDGQGAPGEGNLDADEASKLAGKALDVALNEATSNGNPLAKDELMKLMDSSGDSATAEKIWGDLGAGVLRGETTKSRKTDLWERWTADAVASRLAEGNRLRYQKKIPWDPRITAHGKQPEKHGLVAIDASGSMDQAFLDKLTLIIGETPGLVVEWVSFDATVWPFELGEGGIRGGGGTSFSIIDDWIEDELDYDPDFVLVITDGWAPHIVPRDPDSWIWLITPGGDSWPETSKPPMACREIDIL